MEIKLSANLMRSILKLPQKEMVSIKNTLSKMEVLFTSASKQRLKMLGETILTFMLCLSFIVETSSFTTLKQK